MIPPELSADAAGAMAAIPTPTPADVRRAEFDRYFATRTHFGNLALSHDGNQLAYINNTSGQLNVWRQMTSGGWAWQVTTFEESSARVVLWTPDERIIGIADHQGSEQYQLFSVPARGGALRYLTNRPDVQYQLSEEGLSPDGRWLVYAGNDRDPADSDVLLLDLATGAIRRLLANGHANYAINWSPNGRWITVVDIRSNTDAHLWLVEATTGEAEELLPHDGEEFVAMPGPWLPDSAGFYVTTNRGREFEGVARYALEARALEWVLAPDWDVEHLAASRDGRRLVWTLNVDGRSELYVRDEGAGGSGLAADGSGPPALPPSATLRVAGLPLGVVEQLVLAPDGRTAALRINAAKAPADIYTVRFGEPGSSEPPLLRRLTYGMLGGLAPEQLVEPELTRFAAPDGRSIPAWLYRPRDTSGPMPVVLSIHGGPEAQERVEYHAFYQYLLSRGIAVLAPNIRGSTGYGVSYQKLIHRDWGGAELADIQAAADWLRRQPWVDGARLGIFGGSFGGFATLSAVTRLPEYWSAAVDIVGPSNLLTFVRSVPPTWRRMMAAWVGDPEADADMLRARSPITYVEQARAPLLVMQGAHDPRVVKAESDQMVERLRSLGREVEYVVFEDEGHGFTRRANQLRAYWLAADFFERHLRDGGARPAWEY
jgi:dipeptidyl aminopeptidase/acylaminoacyl peptidase